MSYTDLSTLKKINGIPADLRYFEELNENDAYLKNAADNDEDLTALDRDITPTITSTYKLGSATKLFLEAHVNQILANLLTLPSGTISNPSFNIGSGGLASLGTNELSFVAAGLEPVKFMTSGMLLKAANNSQFKIENTFIGSQGQWTLGVDNTGLSLSDSASAPALGLKVSNTAVQIPTKLIVPSGTALFPSITFGADQTTGFSKDSSLPKINFAISGVEQLSLESSGLSLLSGKLSIPSGSSVSPALSLGGYTDMGLSALAFNSLGLLIGGKVIHEFDADGRKMSIEGSSYDIKKVYAAPGLPSWHTDLVGRANGTKTIPTEVLSGEELYMSAVEGYTDAGWQRVSEITVKALENYSTGSYGASLTFATIPLGETELVEALYINEATLPAVTVPLSFGLGKTLISTAGTGQEINVSNISKLLIDATAGSIGIKGFIGGKEGQMLYIYKRVPANTFTLVFNDGTATQRVLLKGSANYVNTNDYGGITLSFDDGIWREVSRS
jgi:hypothetical protein